MGTMKSFHFHVDTADLLERMSVGAGSCGDAQGASKLLGSAIEIRLRPTVEDLDDIDLRGDPLDRLFAEIAPAAVIRMFEVDETSLLFDDVDRFFRGQPARYRLLEEESDQFALGAEDLLSDDSGLVRLKEQSGAVDTLVVSEEDGGEAQLATPSRHLLWRYARVKGSGAVKVQIDFHNFPPRLGRERCGRLPLAPSATSGTIGRGEGSGKGSRPQGTSVGWHLAGKERLSIRKKSVPWN